MAFVSIDNQKVLDEIGQKLVSAIRQKMVEEGVVASGRLRDSIEYRVDDTGLKILADDYFPYAENGRESGKIPYDFNSILAKWVENKGINVPDRFKNAYQFGWAIAMKIKKYGSMRYRNHNPVDLIEEPINSVIEEVTDLLSRYFLQTINDSLDI